MKRFLKHSTVLCVCLTMALFSATAVAQKGKKGGGGGGGGGGEDPPAAAAPFQYRVEYGYYPAGSETSGILYGQSFIDDGNGTNLYIVGTYGTNNEVKRGYVYNHGDGSFLDVNSALSIDETIWPTNQCRRVTGSYLESSLM